MTMTDPWYNVEIGLRSGLVDAFIETAYTSIVGLVLIPIVSKQLSNRYGGYVLQKKRKLPLKNIEGRISNKYIWATALNLLAALLFIVFQLGVNGKTVDERATGEGIELSHSTIGDKRGSGNSLAYDVGRAENIEEWRDCLITKTFGENKKVGEHHVFKAITLKRSKDGRVSRATCIEEDLVEIIFYYENKFDVSKCKKDSEKRREFYSEDNTKGYVPVVIFNCNDGGAIFYKNPTIKNMKERYMYIKAPVQGMKEFAFLYEKLTPGGLSGILKGWGPPISEHVNISLGWLNVKLAWNGVVQAPKEYYKQVSFTKGEKGKTLVTTIDLRYAAGAISLTCILLILVLLTSVVRQQFTVDIASGRYMNALWLSHESGFPSSKNPNETSDLVLMDGRSSREVTIAATATQV